MIEQTLAQPTEVAQPLTPTEPQPSAPESIDAAEAFRMPLSDLKAMVTGEQPPTAKPAWGEVARNTDGTYQVTLSTGEVFKGTADEVIAKQAEAHVNTKRWAQERKAEAEKYAEQVRTWADQSYKNGQPTGEMPQQPMDPEAQRQAQAAQMEAQRQWLAQMLTPEMKQAFVAEALGIENPQALQMIVNNVWQNNVEFQQQRSYMDFAALAPEYMDTPENADAIAEALGDYPAGHIPSGRELAAAWAVALYSGKAKPAHNVKAIPAPPTPPIMPSAGSPHPEPNLMKMPMAQLRALAEEAIRNGQ